MAAKLTALAFLIVLAGCTDEGRREERERIQSDLPPGCVIHDLGYYAGERLVMVRCDGRLTTTTRYQYRRSNGKSIVTGQRTAIYVGDRHD